MFLSKEEITLLKVAVIVMIIVLILALIVL